MNFKKLLPVFGISMIIGATSFGQQFTFSHDTLSECTKGTAPHPDEFDIGEETWESVQLHNEITNISEDSIQLTWQVLLEETIIPEGWTLFALCDLELCQFFRTGDGTVTAAWALGEPVTPSRKLIPGESADFYPWVCAPSDKADGEAIIRVRAEVVGGTQVDTATFILTKTPDCESETSVHKVDKAGKRVIVFPNPASDQLKVFTEQGLNATKLSVINVIGRELITQKMEAGNLTTVNVSSLPSGIYTIRLTNTDGSVLSAKKFIKN